MSWRVLTDLVIIECYAWNMNDVGRQADTLENRYHLCLLLYITSFLGEKKASSCIQHLGASSARN